MSGENNGYNVNGMRPLQVGWSVNYSVSKGRVTARVIKHTITAACPCCGAPITRTVNRDNLCPDPWYSNEAAQVINDHMDKCSRKVGEAMIVFDDGDGSSVLYRIMQGDGLEIGVVVNVDGESDEVDIYTVNDLFLNNHLRKLQERVAAVQKSVDTVQALLDRGGGDERELDVLDRSLET